MSSETLARTCRLIIPIGLTLLLHAVAALAQGDERVVVPFPEGDWQCRSSWSVSVGGRTVTMFGGAFQSTGFVASYSCYKDWKAIPIRFDRPVRDVRMRVRGEPGLPTATIGFWNYPARWDAGWWHIEIDRPHEWLSVYMTNSRHQYWYLEIAELSFIPVEPGDDAEVGLEITDATPEVSRRVLIHKYGSGSEENGWTHFGADDRYPSPFQTRDGEIEIVATVKKKDGTPVAGRTVYFRVIDPKDPADYVAASKRHAGDNRDPNDAAWIDVTTPKPDPGTGPAGTVSAESAVSDAGGRARTTLRITDRYAGDNYRVVASLDPSFACARPESCATSGELVAWKRIYVSVVPAYKKGGLIQKSVSPGDSVLTVRPIRDFCKGGVIRLIHAPDAPEGGSFYYEDREILNVEGCSDNDNNLGEGQVYVNIPVNMHYEARGYVPDSWTDARPENLADGAAVTSAGRWSASLDLLTRVLFESQVSVVVIENPLLNAPPFASGVDHDSATLLAFRWAAHRTRPNHLHFLVGDRLSQADFGFVSSAFRRAAVVLAGRIEESTVNPEDTFNLLSEVMLHETAHMFSVNTRKESDSSIPDDEHCEHPRWDVPSAAEDPVFPQACVMYFGMPLKGLGPLVTGQLPREYVDGDAAFHAVSNGSELHSEYLDIRRQDEPIPSK